METYLPYPSFADSVATFESRALARVRRTVLNLLEILHETEGWAQPENHPVVEFWRGHEPQLCQYGFIVAEAIRSRPDTPLTGLAGEYERRLEWHMECATAAEYRMAMPDPIGTTEFHIAEQAELLRMDFEHYSNHFEGVPLDIPPYWTKNNRHG